MSFNNLSTINYFIEKAKNHHPFFEFSEKFTNDFDGWKSSLIHKIKGLMGEFPKPVELSPKIIWEIKEDGLIKRKNSICV